MVEDYKDRLVVIIAGYPDEMQAFLSTNPGLQSRFGVHLDFPDLTIENLMKVISQKVHNDGLKIRPDVLLFAGEELENLKQLEQMSFGNARDANRLFQYMKRKLAERVLANHPINNYTQPLPPNWDTFLKSDISGFIESLGYHSNQSSRYSEQLIPKKH
jgi:stage V sporulation protein K